MVRARDDELVDAPAAEVVREPARVPQEIDDEDPSGTVEARQVPSHRRA